MASEKDLELFNEIKYGVKFDEKHGYYIVQICGFIYHLSAWVAVETKVVNKRAILEIAHGLISYCGKSVFNTKFEAQDVAQKIEKQ